MSESRADKLRNAGYFVVSRKYGRIARIDRTPDEYLVFMEREMLGHDLHRYEYFAPQWYDQYRRVYSKDVLTVDQDVVCWLARKGDWSTCTFKQAFAGVI